MHERINEHYRDMWLLRTQTAAVSEYANMTGHYTLWVEVKFIDQDSHWYSRRVKEAIHMRLHPNNINRDSGIQIPEVWMPTNRQHSRPSLPQLTAEGTVSSSNNTNNILDRNPPNMNKVRDTPVTNNHGGTNSFTQ